MLTMFAWTVLTSVPTTCLKAKHDNRKFMQTRAEKKAQKCTNTKTETK